MNARSLRKILAWILILFLLPAASVKADDPIYDHFLYLPIIRRAPGAPILKWQRGGCFSSWCETGWYSSPAVTNMDGDPQAEIIASAYSIWALDGETGAVQWRTKSGHDTSESYENTSNVGRTWPGVVLADVDRDGALEIVTAHGGGYVSVYDLNGRFEAGWEQRPATSELRGLLVADLDGNNSNLEVIVTAAIGSKTSTWVLEANGSIRAGWPQLNNDSGYAYGVFNANAAAANLSGDSKLELIVPSDVHYINGFTPAGVQLDANDIYGSKGWGKVGVWEDLTVEIRGWGECEAGYPRSENYRPNFAHGPATLSDMNGDGVREVVAVGNVHDCSKNPYLDIYHGPYIFNADRSRFISGGYDWRSTPVDTGAPLSQDYNLIESAQPNPVTADLDGDGLKEILFASYDGRMHAFWLDKTEHHSWPYSVYKPAEGFLRFASEPVVVDLENDGLAEVIFTSWVQKSTNRTGKLHVLSAYGVPLYEVDLPAAFNYNWNGSLGAPTLANVDTDADLEVVLMTAHSGVVVYDLPGTQNARILWGTGRGNFRRDGAP